MFISSFKSKTNIINSCPQGGNMSRMLRKGRAWEKWPKEPVDFEFKDTDLAGLPQEIKNGTIPYPKKMRNCQNLFLTEAWDLWYNFFCAAKYRIENEYPEKILANPNDLLFSFSYKDGLFCLRIYHKWAAKALCLPQRIGVRSKNPLDFYITIMPMFSSRE